MREKIFNIIEEMKRANKIRRFLELEMYEIRNIIVDSICIKTS